MAVVGWLPMLGVAFFSGGFGFCLWGTLLCDVLCCVFSCWFVCVSMMFY